MSSAALSEVRRREVTTSRLRTHLLEAGDSVGPPVVFVHGNVSSSAFWEETLDALADRHRCLAPDLRGFGGSERKAVDATRGLRDFADDLHALFEAAGCADGMHLIGWSLGGGVVLQYAIDHPEAVRSLVLVDPMSPYGFGGTRDAAGTPCWPDHAGSGGGTAHPDFVRRLADGDRGDESDLSPRKVMNAFYFKPPFRASPEQEQAYVSSMLSCAIGDDQYPGPSVSSDNWPGVAPGTTGVNNALAPCYCDLSGFAAVRPQPDVLWIRGADDQIVSDTSLFDLGYLGQLGAVPGWPGLEQYPPQPMVTQMRTVLEAYQAAGGRYAERVIADCGHSPHVERPDEFRDLLIRFLEGR